MSNEEELRKLLKPDPTWEQIHDLVSWHFDYLSGDGDGKVTLVKELDSYDDRNFWISLDGKQDFLVKVHNGVESRELLDRMEEDNATDDAYKTSVIHLQNAIMEKLLEDGITTNRPMEPKDKSLLKLDSKILPTAGIVATLPVVSKEHSPTPLVVRLLGWVPGRPMAAFPLLPIEGLADAGRFLGRLSKALGTLELPAIGAAQRYHQWDGKNILDLRGFVDCIDDQTKRDMILSIIEAFQTNLIDSKVGDTQFAKGLIHGDFNDANFLLNNDFCVTGVIDFGDSLERYVSSKLCTIRVLARSN